MRAQRSNSPAQVAPSSTVVTRRSARATALWERATTTLKGQFIALACLLVALVLGHTLLTSARLRQARQALVTIGRDSTPSIDAAQAMAQYVEEIDAKASDLIGTAGLNEARPCTVPGRTPDAGSRSPADCAAQVITVGSALFTNEWYKAVRNVTFPGERTALERIAAGFQEYSGQLALAQYELGQAVSLVDPSDPHLRLAREALLRASEVLDTQISRQPQADPQGNPLVDEAWVPDCTLAGQAIPAVTWTQRGLKEQIECLSGFNKGYFDATYAQAQRDLSVSLTLVVLSSTLLCGALILVQGRLALVTHRVINPGLALALLLSGVAGANAVRCLADLGGPQGDLKVMVRDAYASVYATNLLQHYGTAANADESRWLLAIQFGDQGAAERWAADWERATGQVHVAINQAIRNETFAEEREPLSHLQADWEAYTGLDPQIRALATDTARQQPLLAAQRLSTGDSNAAFSHFLRTVAQLRTANGRYVEQTYQASLERIDGALVWSTWLVPLAGFLAVWGIVGRLKEF